MCDEVLMKGNWVNWILIKGWVGTDGREIVVMNGIIWR